MAETGRLTARRAAPALGPVTLLRIAIIATVLVTGRRWRASGLLFRDVVPSLRRDRHARSSSCSPTRITTGISACTAVEVGTGASHRRPRRPRRSASLLGANRLLSRPSSAILYYLGPTPKIIFFPVMIMWFGVGPGSKVALGTLSCFFPIALSVAAGMRQIDQVLIRVGRASAPTPGRW